MPKRRLFTAAPPVYGITAPPARPTVGMVALVALVVALFAGGALSLIAAALG